MYHSIHVCCHYTITSVRRVRLQISAVFDVLDTPTINSSCYVAPAAPVTPAASKSFLGVTGTLYKS